MNPMRRVASLSIAVWLWACGTNEDKPKALEKAQHRPSAAERDAVLTGRIRLAEGAELPRYAQQDMVRQVLRAGTLDQLPERCKPPEVYDRTPVQLTASRTSAPRGFWGAAMVRSPSIRPGPTMPI